MTDDDEWNHANIKTLDRNDGRVGMICTDLTDGSVVMLDKPYENWVWECAIWMGHYPTSGHWSYEGDRIHLGSLARLTE